MKTWQRVSILTGISYAQAISLLIILPAGFYSKFYRGPAHFWVNNSLSGVFYEIFWCLVAGVFLRRSKPGSIACGVFLATCILEFLQLWHPPALEYARSFFIGSALLGTAFVWSDFPYYLIGSALGWGWLRWLKSRTKDS